MDACLFSNFADSSSSKASLRSAFFSATLLTHHFAIAIYEVSCVTSSSFKKQPFSQTFSSSLLYKLTSVRHNYSFKKPSIIQKAIFFTQPFRAGFFTNASSSPKLLIRQPDSRIPPSKQQSFLPIRWRPLTYEAMILYLLRVDSEVSWWEASYCYS